MLWWNIIAISILAALAVASDSKSATNNNNAQHNIMHHTRELFGLNQVRKLVTCVPPSKY